MTLRSPLRRAPRPRLALAMIAALLLLPSTTAEILFGCDAVLETETKFFDIMT